MQVPKKHFPIVGLLGLMVVAAAGGGGYYYQFVLSHATSTDSNLHLTNAHSFDISGTGSLTVDSSANSPGILPSGRIPFTTWYSVTVTFNSAGTYTYLCTFVTVCSTMHGFMTGLIVVT